ncbi:hypothetical protein PENTCL1PPCAC_18734, partial [Pristionchus entomophagus]
LQLLLLSNVGNAYKFLVYNSQSWNSHMNFMSKLSDTLIDAGHEVVMVSPRTNTLLGSPKTKARVIEVAQSSAATAFQHRHNSKSGGFSEIWTSGDFVTQRMKLYPMFAVWVSQCEVTLADRELIESLINENFDGAFTEHFDSCGYALFHILKIRKYATTVAIALMDGLFSVSQVPLNTAYVPSHIGGWGGDRMSFLDRVSNTLAHLFKDNFLKHFMAKYQTLVDRILEDPPNFEELMSNSSLVFTNSDPLADFPKLTSSRVIDIGGITAHAGRNPLDQYWSSVLSLRNHTVLISFGSLIKSHMMPDSYKETIRETARKFPHVTFVWKYEIPEHNMSLGVDNLIETTWAPQYDILSDPRLTAFISHGGQNSVTESAGAGVPLICIPIMSDQYRNAKQIERNGVGIMLNKDDLGQIGPLEAAIEMIIKDNSYKSNAVILANMIADRPFSMKDIFVRNMEFMVKYGPHERFHHYGSKLSFFQYYLIDVFAFIALFAVGSMAIAFYSMYLVVNHFFGNAVLKKLKRH